MARSTITAKGQLTVPKEIRDRFGLHRGDILDFNVDESGRITLRLLEEHDLGVLRDFAPETGVSVEEMKEAVRSRARRKSTA